MRAAWDPDDLWRWTAAFEQFREIAILRDYDRTSISGRVDDFPAACT